MKNQMTEEIKKGRGGARPGAGRPRGSKQKIPNSERVKIAREGAMPLDVMLAAMRAHLAGNRLDQAAAIAKDAAPYLHPRLSASEVTVRKSPLDDVEPATLAALADALERGEGGPPDGGEAPTRH